MAGTITGSTLLPMEWSDKGAAREGWVRKWVVDFVADAADGSVPTLNSNLKIEGRLIQIITNPGAVAPTTLYDITVVDPEGADMLLGVGANRSATVTEVAGIILDNGQNPVVNDILTFGLINNSVNSATGRFILFFGKP